MFLCGGVVFLLCKYPDFLSPFCSVMFMDTVFDSVKHQQQIELSGMLWSESTETHDLLTGDQLVLHFDRFSCCQSKSAQRCRCAKRLQSFSRGSGQGHAVLVATPRRFFRAVINSLTSCLKNLSPAHVSIPSCVPLLV